MKTPPDFDHLFEASRDSESFELEELCFKVAHRLSERLEESGMTQARLARHLRVSPAYISKVMHGKPENMTLATIVKFARALDCRVLAPKIVARDAASTGILSAAGRRGSWSAWPEVDEKEPTMIATVVPETEASNEAVA